MSTTATEFAPQARGAVCPICEGAPLDATRETFDLEDILRRWQVEAKAEITDPVWRQYTQPEPPRVTLHSCGNCGFGVFLPPVAGTPEFYECVTPDDGSVYTPEKWEFLQAVRDLRRHGCRRVLDVGSGSGYFLDLVRARLPRVSVAGLEFNAEMARLVRAKGHEVYCGESFDAIPEGVGPFDAVCIFQVLEHVADPRALIETARRLLAPGGILIIAVPDNEGPVKYFSKALTELPPHHLSRWRASTFRLGLPQMGFAVLRVAHDPLHSSMWQDYLPVILEHSRLPRPLARALSKNDRLTRLLRKLRLRWLRGVRGHSIYVVARGTGAADLSEDLL